MKKECSQTEAFVKAEAYCSMAERCKSEVIRKLWQWGVPINSETAILAHLEKENYVNESRYAAAFVRDKYRFAQWGRIKIIQALRVKQIPENCIEEGLKQIEEEEYLSILTGLLEKKKRTVKARNDYELNGKLIRFAAGHGYELNDILFCLKRLGCDDEYLE